MTENGDSKENAQTRHLNGKMKNELHKGRRLFSVTEVRVMPWPSTTTSVQTCVLA